jgi:phosphatidylglycerophosphate synthase
VKAVNYELRDFFVLVLFMLVGIIGACYALRVNSKGHQHFDRIDQQGGSLLLSKEIMEMGYWFLQSLAKFLVYCRVTANQISWASLAFGFFAACCLAFGHFGTGSILALISASMDSLDGQVARMTGNSSDAGEVFDCGVDRYVEFFFLGALVIYYRQIPILLVLALVALLGSYMVSYSTLMGRSYQIDPPKGNMRRPERALYLTLGAALSTVTIPLFENGNVLIR